MTEGGTTGRGKSPKGRAAAPRKHEWITRQLQRVYDEALQEEIPAEMLALLGKLDEEKPRDRSPGDEEERP